MPDRKNHVLYKPIGFPFTFIADLFNNNIYIITSYLGHKCNGSVIISGQLMSNNITIYRNGIIAAGVLKYTPLRPKFHYKCILLYIITFSIISWDRRVYIYKLSRDGDLIRNQIKRRQISYQRNVKIITRLLVYCSRYPRDIILKTNTTMYIIIVIPAI